MKINNRIIWVLAAVIMLSANVYAHKGATGVVRERMDRMSDMGEAMKAMADMLKGKSDFSMDIIRNSATILTQHASTLVDYFPDTDASRNSKQSDALPIIWESWERFDSLSNKFGTAVADLKQASENELDKRTLRLVFTKTARACSACHEDFRRAED